MKKCKSIIAVLLFLAVLIGSGWIYGNIPEKTKKQKEIMSMGAEENLVGPDIEQLAFYGLDEFQTELPVIFIDIKGQRLSKEQKVWAEMGVLNDGGSIMEMPDYVVPITIKLRGASSYAGFDKSQYRIKFYKKEGSSKAKDYEFLGMGENSEWVLNGPFLDKTLMRNRLIYGLGREIFEWAPDSRYVEVFVDGAYQGVYLAVEPVTNGVSRLRLSEFGLLSGETPYIIKRDRVGTEDYPMNIYGKTSGKTNNDLFIQYPTSSNITKEQRDWIEKDVSAFEKVLYSDKFADPEEGYANYIDVDTFVDYVIFNEAVMNNDAGNLSTYIYKELAGKLQITIWDYNNAYDNYQEFSQDYSEFFMKESAWFSRLLQDRSFIDKVTKRYQELRQGTLSTEHMHEQIGLHREELGGAVDRNFAVWGYSFNQNLLIEEGRELVDYESAVSQLKDAIVRRMEFLDTHMTDLYNDCIN